MILSVADPGSPGSQLKKLNIARRKELITVLAEYELRVHKQMVWNS